VPDLTGRCSCGVATQLSVHFATLVPVSLMLGIWPAFRCHQLEPIQLHTRTGGTLRAAPSPATSNIPSSETHFGSSVPRPPSHVVINFIVPPAARCVAKPHKVTSAWFFMLCYFFSATSPPKTACSALKLQGLSAACALHITLDLIFGRGHHQLRDPFIRFYRRRNTDNSAKQVHLCLSD
jgi:hypothetical protein